MDAPRPGRARSESARLAILAATRDELTRNGYDKLSIDRIAAAAGVGKATIYRWYPSKSALVAEGVLEGHLMPTPPVLDTGDVRADMATWLAALAELDIHSDGAALIRATAAATAEDDEVARRYDERVTAVARSAVSDLLRRGIDAGQLAPDAPIDTIVDLFISIVIFRILSRHAITRDLIDDMVALLLPQPSFDRK
jgi:AcrR family transcriptional regulator